MSKVSFVNAGEVIVIVIDSQTFNVATDHPNYGIIVEALRDNEVDDLVNLINMERAIADFSQGKLTVEDGEVSYQTRPLPMSLADRILDMLDQGFTIDPMVAFLDNLFENPSMRAVNELYSFMEKNKLPITSDGHFLAYKNVSGSYKDIHSGSFDNSIGQTCEMPRNAVQDNKDVTCSEGLHFCGLSYLSSFGGEHTMILKINPRDVVSIPSDYNDAKGRTCRYEVVGEHEAENRYKEPAFDRAVQDEGGADERSVVAVDREDDLLIEVFDNIQAAADDCGCPVSYIRRVLVGDREATQGYRWMYESDWDEYLEEVEGADSW